MSEGRAERVPAALELVVDRDPTVRAGVLLEAMLRRLADETTDTLRVAIPGGSALAAVAIAVDALGALWRRVALTWTDERCVPLASPESNRGEAMRLGLLSATSGFAARRACASPPYRVLPLFEDGESVEAAVARSGRRFEAELGGALDVAVLGLGEDGHVASLFPGRRAETGFVAGIHDSPKPPPDRVTLTRRALATARHSLLVATGETKRGALTRLLAADPALPATGLPGLVVVTDLDLDRGPDRSQGDPPFPSTFPSTRPTKKRGDR